MRDNVIVYNVIHHIVMQYIVIPYNVIVYNVIHHIVMQYNVIRDNVIL